MWCLEQQLCSWVAQIDLYSFSTVWSVFPTTISFSGCGYSRSQCLILKAAVTPRHLQLKIFLNKIHWFMTIYVIYTWGGSSDISIVSWIYWPTCLYSGADTVLCSPHLGSQCKGMSLSKWPWLYVRIDVTFNLKSQIFILQYLVITRCSTCKHVLAINFKTYPYMNLFWCYHITW